jgi:iron complex outermembrane receptor protein
VNEPSTFNAAETSLQAYNFTETQNAAYGQITWNITDKLAVVGGLRYQKDVKNETPGQSYEVVSPNGGIYKDWCFTACTVAATYSGYGSWSKIQWHAGINYNLSPDSLLFASVATGYKSGGFNTGAQLPYNPTFGPENLTDYELGWKTKLFDNRAQINVDAFYMPYKNYQVTSSLIETTGAFIGQYEAVTLNSGTADIKGIEFESTFLVTPVDKVTFYATALRAIFTDFNLPLGDGYCVVGAHCDTNYTGNLLPYAPATTEKLAYEHTFAFPGSDSLLMHLDSAYSADYYLDYHDYTSVDQRSYTRSNAWLTWQRRRDNTIFNTQIYVRNIENKAILAGGQADSAAPGKDFDQYGKNGYYLPPRTYGIQFYVSL